MTAQAQDISAAFPFQSHYVEVHGSKMHYVDEGKGDPIIFLHGVPTSSYLWRNIIPTVSQHARCIAVDMIGMGKSDKPDLPYRVFDFIKYLEGFIEALNLKKITLVMHAWGSVIGFDYARRHSNNVKALAFMEAHIRPVKDWKMLSLPVQEFTLTIQQAGKEKILNSDFYIEQIFANACMRKLSTEELNYYKEAFKTPESRKLIWQYLQDIPLGKGPEDVVALIENYSKWLQETRLPKLMLYNVPGFITTMETVMWASQHLPNLQIVDIDFALHYPQEYQPQLIADELSKWYTELNTTTV